MKSGFLKNSKKSSMRCRIANSPFNGTLRTKSASWRGGPSTRIFLGLIHFRDGLEGSLRRLRVAERFIRDFGVASECGFGRRDPQTIRDLLILHKAVATAE